MFILSGSEILLRLALTVVLLVNALGAFPASARSAEPASARRDVERPSVPEISDPSDCHLYPIALSAESLAEASVGDTLADILNGDGPGNFGWLSWSGSPSEQALVTSLTPPGNSETYINPDDPDDHTVSVGDWVSGRPGVANSNAVRQALETLKELDIAVPVWDEVHEQGNNAAYRVAAYARIRLLDYRLPGQNRISARFLGYTCEGAVIRLGKSVDSTRSTWPSTLIGLRQFPATF